MRILANSRFYLVFVILGNDKMNAQYDKVNAIKRNDSVPLFEKKGLGEILLDKSPSIPLFQRGR